MLSDVENDVNSLCFLVKNWLHTISNFPSKKQEPVLKGFQKFPNYGFWNPFILCPALSL